MIGKVAIALTVLLTLAVVFVESLHAELIIFALAAGLTTVVKASILGNVLPVLGASYPIGGLKNGTHSGSQCR